MKTLDGVQVGGWFAEDFTAAEIRAEEQLRDLRTANNAHNGQYVIPTLQEVIDLAQAKSAEPSAFTRRPSTRPISPPTPPPTG